LNSKADGKRKTGSNCLKGISGKLIVDEKGMEGVHGKADE